MLEFRRNLPTYKEKNRLLTAISKNQVCENFAVFHSRFISTIHILETLYLKQVWLAFFFFFSFFVCQIIYEICILQVVIISGETGCGKTTQIPQFILESEIESVRGAVCSIICTQPRRISAMSVSERVASERGEKLGESVSSCLKYYCLTYLIKFLFNKGLWHF